MRRLCVRVVFAMAVLGGAANGEAIVVNNRAKNAADENAGTQVRPLRTIQAAADRAQPGDTILVRAGIYREEVVPPRGGTSPENAITYKAAPGELVSIRGSEQITDWVHQGGGVWMVRLDTALFGDYNPFAIPVDGEWLSRTWRRLGDVYLDGEALRQTATRDKLKATPNTWYTDLQYGYANKFEFPDDRQYPNGKIEIWANFGDANPNTAMTEINARATAIFPEQAGLKYVVIDGFDICHTAPQWGDIYTLEEGAIGAKYGYGWIIQNCTITNSRNIGISLGVSDEVYFPRDDEGGVLEGGSNIPPLDSIGHHLIRNNVIRRCGQTSIYGCYGAVGCVIEGNVIVETNYRNEWHGMNQAAIKLLFPIDTVIRDNLLIGMSDIHNKAKGIWLDWGAQNARVTGNVVCDFGANLGLFMEVNFGPTVVDNNVFIRSMTVIESDGSVLAHNLSHDCSFLLIASPHRTTPYYKPHSTMRTGKAFVTLNHLRIFNNVISGGAGFGGERLFRKGSTAADMLVDYNAYFGGAKGYQGQDTSSVVVDDAAAIDFDATTESAALKFEVPAVLLRGNRQLVTSKRIGKIPLAEMYMEHPDGTPLDIDRDFFGKPIKPENVRPGPFQTLTAGENRLQLWPK